MKLRVRVDGVGKNGKQYLDKEVEGCAIVAPVGDGTAVAAAFGYLRVDEVDQGVSRIRDELRRNSVEDCDESDFKSDLMDLLRRMFS
jgi:hypothetical protein